jgi:DHA2 family multidrug resistance protein
MAPVGVLAIVVSPVLGKWMGRVDPRVFTSISFALFAWVFFLRAGFTPGTDMAHLIWPTFLQGAALPLFFMPLTAISLSGLASQRLPAATGLASAVRITEGAMGTSIVTTLWEQRTALHRAHLTELLALGDRGLQGALDALQSSGIPMDAALAQLNRMIDQQAATRGMDDVFTLSSWMLLAMMGLVWLAHGPGQAARSSGAAPADAAAAAAH